MKERAARLLGAVLHPAVPGFFVALDATLVHEGALTRRLVAVAVMVSLACVGVPMGTLMLGALLGRTRGDVWGDRRETRVVYFYPGAAVGLIASYAIFDQVYPFPLARSMVASAGGVILLLAAANRWLKASIHTAGNTAIATAAVWTYGAGAAPLFLLVPAVAWARVAARKHTVPEVIAGAAIGLVVTVSSLAALG